MTRYALRAKRWILLVGNGLAALPLYARHWGVVGGLRRLGRATLLHGLIGLLQETSGVRRLYAQSKSVPRLKPSGAPLDFIVHAPNYMGKSAGVKVLFMLAQDLKARGLEVAVTGCTTGPDDFRVPVVSFATARQAARAGTWVVYPEIVFGNPLRAKNVVRWVLGKPGFLGGDEIYAETEHVFIYSEFYRRYVKNVVQGKIQVLSMDEGLFYPASPEQPRPLECYYIGKSIFKPGYFDPAQTFEVTRDTPPKTELGKLFRASRRLYCFDNSTALIQEALLCGCPVTIIPDQTQAWEDFEKLELGIEGLTWATKVGPTPVENFYPTDLIARLAAAREAYRRQIDFLLRYTKKERSAGSDALKQASHPAEL